MKKPEETIHDNLAERKHDQWIDWSECPMCVYYKSIFEPFMFCPMCGTMMDLGNELYLCDPDKNTECKKQSCFINGGPCKYTTKERCKKDEE